MYVINFNQREYRNYLRKYNSDKLRNVFLYCFYMVAYFCHHLSDNYVELSDLYVDLSVIYVDLSDRYVDLSEKYHSN